MRVIVKSVTQKSTLIGGAGRRGEGKERGGIERRLGGVRRGAREEHGGAAYAFDWAERSGETTAAGYWRAATDRRDN